MKKYLLIPLFSIMLLPTYVFAQSLSEKNISLADAKSLANAAVESCMGDGYNVSVTVVDRGGNVKVVERMDNAGPHTIKGSAQKAFTALSTRTSTSTVMENTQKNAGAANMKDIPGFLLLGGGLPVKIGNETIGAIGIAGAPGGHLDEICAQKALDKVKIK